ncbi:MAG: hypothetical protein ACK5WZ_15230 [Pseudobdellovibrionaceae bacterium]
MKKSFLVLVNVCKRILIGLANARAKGRQIGRAKKRNDLLIFSLLDAGLSFREIGRISSCSQGSVSAAKKDWLKLKAAKEAGKISKITDEIKMNQTNDVVNHMKSMNLPEEFVAKVQNKIEEDARANVKSIQGDVVYDTCD